MQNNIITVAIVIALLSIAGKWYSAFCPKINWKGFSADWWSWSWCILHCLHHNIYSHALCHLFPFFFYFLTSCASLWMAKWHSTSISFVQKESKICLRGCAETSKKKITKQITTLLSNKVVVVSHSLAHCLCVRDCWCFWALNRV